MCGGILTKGGGECLRSLIVVVTSRRSALILPVGVFVCSACMLCVKLLCRS